MYGIRSRNLVSIFAVAPLLFLAQVGTAGEEFISMAPGLFNRTVTIKHGARQYRLYLIKANPKLRKVRVFTGRSVANSKGFMKNFAPDRALSGLNLDEFSKVVPAQVLLAGSYLRSYHPVAPIGYLKIDGKVVSRQFKSWLLDSMFCAGEGSVVIWGHGNIPLRRERAFENCLQSGPMLTSNGVNVIRRQLEIKGAPQILKSAYHQVFICIGSDQHFYAGFVDKISLLELASLLAAKSKDPNLPCKEAMSLASRLSAAMVVPKLKLWLGDINSFQGSVVAIE